jgi:hypothetical protein
MRTTCGEPERGGMQSTTRMVPSAVSQNVSSTSVSPRYCRRLQVPPAAGASQPVAVLLVTEQRREAGRRVELGQAQPVDRTVRPTSAAVCRSPSSA